MIENSGEMSSIRLPGVDLNWIAPNIKKIMWIYLQGLLQDAESLFVQCGCIPPTAPEAAAFHGDVRPLPGF